MFNILSMIGIKHKSCREGHIMDSSWRICPICISPICGWLVMNNKKQNRKIYNIHDGRSKIGSGPDCEILMPFEGISRQHAMLVVEDCKFIISDLSSISGTFVNYKPITRQEVIDGDIIKLGNIEFKIKCI
ncbi:MAG: FHA domain-containing protein [Spirochaetota bacterium]|nr:FHA domain-containing protein [Spirochaetota bacterium]